MLAVVAVGIAAVVIGCAGDEPPPAGRAEGDGRLDGSITVAGARSLADPFTRIADDFAAANPGVEVAFTFDSSSVVAGQILEGAPADVFASADRENMARLAEEGLIAGAPEVFARNALTIVTRPGNPAGITGLEDLASAGVVSLCGAEVPCGRYADRLLVDAGVSIPESRVTRGQNASATLTAVAEGDAVAGIVYVTDAKRAGDTVEPVGLPPERNVSAAYPIAVLRASGEPEVAEAFVAHVLSREGRAVLAASGFQPPS